MRTVYVQELMRLPLGKQGENGAARIVWQGLAARYQALYGSGAFTLTAKRCGDAAAYPVAVSTEGGDVVWLVRAADVASPGSGSCELTYTVDGAVAKSQTWSTYVAASISGDAPGEPPEEPAKAWFAAIQAQIGNLDDLTTKAKANLVAAVNEAAKTGSGGGADIDLGMTGAAAGQVAKVKAVDTDGKPTAWEPADLPGGGGNEWVKVAETTLTEIVNEIRLNFDPCKAVYLEFQYGAVENDLGVIGIYPNPQTPIYTAEKRSCAVDTTTSAANKRGYIFCTIDRRKGTQWVATSQIFYRSEVTFGSIKPGEAMNCDIDIFNNNTWASVLWKPKLVGTDYINSVSAFGAGMNIGTTLTVWGVKA